MYFYQYIKIFDVCPSVCNGCGRGCNELAGRVQNHHVRFSFHRNGHLRYSSKSCCRSGHCIADYAKDAIVSACHRTSDGQEHKIIWRAGQKRDTVFHLRVTECREQGSHCRDERLAWVASRVRCRGLQLESLGSEQRANYILIITTFILWLAMCTDRK